MIFNTNNNFALYSQQTGYFFISIKMKKGILTDYGNIEKELSPEDAMNEIFKIAEIDAKSRNHLDGWKESLEEFKTFVRSEWFCGIAK